MFSARSAPACRLCHAPLGTLVHRAASAPAPSLPFGASPETALSEDSRLFSFWPGTHSIDAGSAAAPASPSFLGEAQELLDQLSYPTTVPSVAGFSPCDCSRASEIDAARIPSGTAPYPSAYPAGLLQAAAAFCTAQAPGLAATVGLAQSDTAGGGGTRAHRIRHAPGPGVSE